MPWGWFLAQANQHHPECGYCAHLGAGFLLRQTSTTQNVDIGTCSHYLIVMHMSLLSQMHQQASSLREERLRGATLYPDLSLKPRLTLHAGHSVFRQYQISPVPVFCCSKLFQMIFSLLMNSLINCMCDLMNEMVLPDVHWLGYGLTLKLPFVSVQTVYHTIPINKPRLPQKIGLDVPCNAHGQAFSNRMTLPSPSFLIEATFVAVLGISVQQVTL